MPDYELHADFDRNGRLDATSSEHALRATAPGAILVANLDADGRRLPTTVQPSRRVILDREQPVILANDDEALPLRIQVVAASAPAGSRFFLRPLGFPKIRVRFNDAQGRILPRDLAREHDIPIALPTAPGQLNLTLTVRTLPGSPIGHVTDLDARFVLDPADESTFRVQLISVDGSGVETQHDEARFTIAPFVIVDHSAVAVRTYVCEIPDNQASVLELEEAHRLLRVPLLKVPAHVANGDTWLQDQFQHALVQGADRWRQVLLHLPRLRADSQQGSSASNLATFVTSHFPSRDLGVFDDLWDRTLQVFDAAGAQRRIGFRQCDELAVVMHQVVMLAAGLVDSIMRLDPRYEPTWPDGWSGFRAWLPELVRDLRGRVQRARGEASPHWRATLDGLLADAHARLHQVAGRVPYDAGRQRVGLPVGGGPMELHAADADRVFIRVLQMHHSSNYGGNIEASPPTPDAPLGKLVIGNMVVDEHDFMDPDVLRLLYKQRKQPIVELDTTWLDVGHVDEIMCFGPDRRSGAGQFAVLRASPELALRLIQGARDRYVAGLPSGHVHETGRISGVLPRLTTAGSAPVTRLLRGKAWSHVHGPAAGGHVPSVLEPPRIYQDVSQALNGGDPADPDSGTINIHDIHYWPGEGPERRYPADITVQELLYGEQDFDGQSTNAFIETQRIAPSARRLLEAFGGARHFPLPVLFDRVASTAQWTMAPMAFTTAAFTPDVVNMQVINGRLLIPRPYGPRMRPADAIAVISAAMRAMKLPDGLVRRLDARFIRRHQLTTGIYWVHRQDPVYRTTSGIGTVRSVYGGLTTEADVIEQFRDSYPGASDSELRRRIIRPNRRHFDARGQLRDGWRKLSLDEDMVDLFETAIMLVVAELDVPVSWIDSWYYHVHAGGIHCGTNVLRVPGRGSTLPDVWTVPDASNGAAPMDFEAEDIVVPRRSL